MATVGIEFEFEEGGKLWPVYYMEDIDPSMENSWKPYFVWFQDGYIEIPQNGKDGLVIDWVSVEPGDYRAEVQVSNYYGDYNEPLKFDIRIEQNQIKLPDVLIANDGNKVLVKWLASPAGAQSLLQWTEKLGSTWQNIPPDQYEIEDDSYIYKERPRQEKRFYRLIKP